MNMVGNEIHDQPDPACPGRSYQLIQSSKASEMVLNRKEVGSVIPVIRCRPGKRREPESRNAKFLQIVQLLRDTLEVPSAENWLIVGRNTIPLLSPFPAEEAVDKDLINDRLIQPAR